MKGWVWQIGGGGGEGLEVAMHPQSPSGAGSVQLSPVIYHKLQFESQSHFIKSLMGILNDDNICTELERHSHISFKSIDRVNAFLAPRQMINFLDILLLQCSANYSQDIHKSFF